MIYQQNKFFSWSLIGVQGVTEEADVDTLPDFKSVCLLCSPTNKSAVLKALEFPYETKNSPILSFLIYGHMNSALVGAKC